MRYRSLKTGFTIVQLIVAVSVLIVLAVASITAFNPAKRVGQANDAKRWEDLTAIAKAIELYQLDNDSLPADFNNTTDLAVGEKFVLCSSEASKTCDGQTETCLQIDDADFLGVYLPDLPVDPTKSDTTDTGYYITRQGDNRMALGACNSYGSTIELVAKAAIPSLVTVCGDGDTEGSEVCDDGDTFTEGCGNGIREPAGTYCNSNCTATVVIASQEPCDYFSPFHADCLVPVLEVYYTEADDCNKPVCYCASDCSALSLACLMEG